MSVTRLRACLSGSHAPVAIAESLDRAARSVGYRRSPVVSSDGAVNEAMVIAKDSERSRDASVSWPGPDYEPQPFDRVVLRFALPNEGRPFGVTVELSIGESAEVVELELAVSVALKLMSYSERRRDAMLRLLALGQFIEDEGFVESTALECDEVPRAETDALNMETIDRVMPLETTRRRARKVFIEWATSGGHPTSLELHEDLELPVIRVACGTGDIEACIPCNLFNGSDLGIDAVSAGFHAADQDLEKRHLQQCWRFADGLAKVEEVHGEPCATLGGFDPTPTRLSSLEPIRDQWVYSNLADHHLVLFREYETGRIAVNTLGLRQDIT